MQYPLHTLGGQNFSSLIYYGSRVNNCQTDHESFEKIISSIELYIIVVLIVESLEHIKYSNIKYYISLKYKYKQFLIP